MNRLKTHVVTGALIRRAQAAGVFATVLHRGDPDAGLLYAVTREPGGVGLYAYLHDEGWQPRSEEGATEADVASRIEQEREFDRDLWVIELDGRGAAAVLAE
ncbi:DUF1491 family protein [Parvularcula dongshanensis]|uniref:DUF1491 family protein n=1 Tax=Parvularcula dongshanensis TaxID=1173995 RepID=A0A840I2U8_9PROT|nr:DUF1491 family protein [Parvularcula dongshanensis]MBB4658544.1 hypothetical protein [Parvularcula dongshanensis]